LPGPGSDSFSLVGFSDINLNQYLIWNGTASEKPFTNYSARVSNKAGILAAKYAVLANRFHMIVCLLQCVMNYASEFLVHSAKRLISIHTANNVEVGLRVCEAA